MKKIILLFIIIFNISYGELAQYKSNFGLGVGMGFPSGYEFKGIYRQNDYLSISLNYNIFEIKDVSENITNSDMNMDIVGSFLFSTPGVVLNYHPFAGNFRVEAGFLYDMGGLKIDTEGTLKIENIQTNVTGNISVKLGRTYPYLGIAYGYAYSSVVHIDFSLGTYLLKRPEVDLYFNVGNSNTIKSILNSAGITDATTQTNIVNALNASGGNILDLPQIVADEFGLPNTIIMPSSASLEEDMIGLMQEGYSMLPEFMGYSLLPVISVGFTVFPFQE